MAEQVMIERRFRGPEESGNGGYSCGTLSRFVDPHAAEVTLRLPPPLERPLAVEAVGGERVEMRDGDAVVAEAGPIGELDLDIPTPLGVEEAAAARDGSPMQHEHPYPHCFVCGPDRGANDGLRVTCGPTGDRQVVAAPWTVDESLPSEDGAVAPEIVWSVLDCPGGISTMPKPGRPGSS